MAAINALTTSILKITEAQEDNRYRLLLAARALVTELESPQDVMLALSKAVCPERYPLSG
jgi:hypothetical protein